MRTEQDWADECRYIAEVTAKRGNVKEMGYSKDTFVTYCEMQLNAARKQGRYDSATYIQECLDDLS